MPKLIFHPDVSNEIMVSYNWYQGKAEGLGEDFINELESAFHTIIEFPQTGPNFKEVSKILAIQVSFLSNLSKKC